MEEPLLNGSSKVDEEDPSAEASSYALWRSDLRDVCLLSGPACLQLAFQYAVIVTNQAMAGHLGADQLAAAAIAVTFFNILFYFCLGTTSALDTLGSQAYGANNRAGVISWAITCLLSITILSVPMAAALYRGDWVAIHFFQQPPEIADLVGLYCQGMIPGLAPFFWSLVIMKAMQAQNKMWGPTWVTVGMFFANFAINLVGIRLYGFWGAAYAQSASRIVQFLFLVFYVLIIDNECVQYDKPVWLAVESPLETAPLLSSPEQQTIPHEDLPGSSAPSPVKEPYMLPSVEESPKHTTTLQLIKHGLQWNRIAVFFKLGFPGGCMMAADASAFDITTALAGLLGTAEVGAHTALLTLCVFIYMSVPFGIATAATIRVGNMLGAGNPTAARRTAWLTMGLCAIYSTIATILIAGFHNEIGFIFTDDPKVVAITAKIALLAAIYQLPDAVYAIFSGVLRGMGRQAQLVWCNVGGFWVIGTVVGFLLAFKAHLGVAGLWIGINCGVTACAVFTTALLYLVDWDAESAKAQAYVLKADLACATGQADPLDDDLLTRPSGLPIPRHESAPGMPSASPIAMSVGSHGRRLHPVMIPGSVSGALSGSYINRMALRDPVSRSFAGR